MKKFMWNKKLVQLIHNYFRSSNNDQLNIEKPAIKLLKANLNNNLLKEQNLENELTFILAHYFPSGKFSSLGHVEVKLLVTPEIRVQRKAIKPQKLTFRETGKEKSRSQSLAHPYPNSIQLKLPRKYFLVVKVTRSTNVHLSVHPL